MYIIKALTASFAFAYLAACSDVSDIAVRDLADPVSPAELERRTGSERIVQIVQVGDNNGSLKFFPEQVVAEVGSVVQFQFYPKNHTITESSFAAPCVPIAANLTNPQRPGQKSGFVPVTADAQFRPVYNLIVNDTKPMWIFCGQMPHCLKGMAMVINQNASTPEKSIEKYKEAAAKLPLPSGAPGPPPASPPAASPPATAPPAGATTVTPVAATNTGGGPSLVGSTTAAAAIATFTGGASVHKGLPAVAMAGFLAAGLIL